MRSRKIVGPAVTLDCVFYSRVPLLVTLDCVFYSRVPLLVTNARGLSIKSLEHFKSDKTLDFCLLVCLLSHLRRHLRPHCSHTIRPDIPTRPVIPICQLTFTFVWALSIKQVSTTSISLGLASPLNAVERRKRKSPLRKTVGERGALNRNMDSNIKSQNPSESVNCLVFVFVFTPPSDIKATALV